MSNYTYELDENNAVSIFTGAQEVPVIFQPTWPDNTPWASPEEATEWAETFINSMEDADYQFIVGDGPDQPKKPKPESVVLPESE